MNQESAGIQRRQWWFSVCLLILLLIVVVSVIWLIKDRQFFMRATKNQPGLYSVIKFDDGDTIMVNMNGRQETIRFIGVDTPETHDPRKNVQCYGYAAADFTKKLIGKQSVRLEADPLGTNRDRYNRLLRYVYIADGQLVNAEIIKQGYGFAYVSFPFQKSQEFAALQTEAQNQKRGLWSSCQPIKNEFGGYTANDAN